MNIKGAFAEEGTDGRDRRGIRPNSDGRVLMGGHDCLFWTTQMQIYSEKDAGFTCPPQRLPSSFYQLGMGFQEALPTNVDLSTKGNDGLTCMYSEA